MYDSHEKADIRYTNPEYRNKNILRQKALIRARQFFKDNIVSIREFDGADGYNPNIYQKDLFTTDKLRSRYDEAERIDPDKQWSTIQEAIILNEFEMSDWFGESTRTIKPTDHADFVQGIDGVLDVEQNKVAFDATFNKKPYLKVKKGKELLDEDRLSEITYFFDEQDNFKGRIELPKIVLGFGKENLMELAEQWLYSQEGIPGSKKRIAENPVQMLLIYQALIQFSAFELYCEKYPTENEYLPQFKILKAKLLDIYNDKISSSSALKNYQFDDFTETLMHDVAREYGIKIEDIQNNIWPKKEPKKVFKIPRTPSPGPDQSVRAAA